MQDKIRNLIHNLPEDWDSIIKLLYQCYASRGEKLSPQICDYHRIIEEYTNDFPYEIQNQISTAAVGLCVEYERIGFADGVTIGAKLVAELLMGE